MAQLKYGTYENLIQLQSLKVTKQSLVYTHDVH